MVFVTSPGEGNHDKGGKDVRWSDKAVGFGSVEAHTVLQNDRKEVRDSIGNRGRHHEDESESNDLRLANDVSINLRYISYVELD